VQPSETGNASAFVDILHATLRGAGCRWNAPEWLATGSGADMAAYTASLTAHAPFVRSATQRQNAYKKVFKQFLWKAIEYGRLRGKAARDIDYCRPLRESIGRSKAGRFHSLLPDVFTQSTPLECKTSIPFLNSMTSVKRSSSRRA